MGCKHSTHNHVSGASREAEVTIDEYRVSMIANSLRLKADVDPKLSNHADIVDAACLGRNTIGLLRTTSYSKAVETNQCHIEFVNDPVTDKLQVNEPVVVYSFPSATMLKYPTFIFVGRPNADLVERVCRQYDLKHITSLDAARSAQKSKAGGDAMRALLRGNRLPTGLAVHLLTNRMIDLDNKAGYLLDDFPQTAEEADYLRAVGVHPSIVVRFISKSSSPSVDLTTMDRILEQDGSTVCKIDADENVASAYKSLCSIYNECLRIRTNTSPDLQGASDIKDAIESPQQSNPVYATHGTPPVARMKPLTEESESETKRVNVFLGLIAYLEQEKSLREEGLFRVSGSKDDVDKIVDTVVKTERLPDLSSILDPNVVVGVLKRLIKHFKLPIDEESATKLAIAAEQESPAEAIISTIAKLDSSRAQVLQAICNLLSKVLQSSRTKMSILALAIAFGPTLFPNIELSKTQTILEALCSS